MVWLGNEFVQKDKVDKLEGQTRSTLRTTLRIINICFIFKSLKNTYYISSICPPTIIQNQTAEDVGEWKFARARV